MDMSKGIAIAAIWIAVGMIGLNDRQGWSAVVALFAFMATLVVCLPAYKKQQLFNEGIK